MMPAAAAHPVADPQKLMFQALAADPAPAVKLPFHFEATVTKAATSNAADKMKSYFGRIQSF